MSSATKIKSQAVETLLMSLMESKKKEVEDGAWGTSRELLPRAENLPLIKVNMIAYWQTTCKSIKNRYLTKQLE